MSKLIKLSDSQTLTVIASTPDILQMESVWAPGAGKKPPRHYHPKQSEHFEVLEGELTVELADEPPRTLKAGDTLEIPAGTVHRMWNASSAVTRATWRVTPALGTEEMFKFIAGGVSPLRSVMMLVQFRNEFRLASPRRKP